MKILVLSQYFWPESFIINDIVRTLDEQGHEVVVATGKPNYPDGDIFEGYQAGGTQRERYLDRVDVVRVPLWPRGAGGAKNLILNYLSFVLAGLFCLPWLLRKRQFDAILVFAPSPILQAIPAIPLKWIKGARLALWVQDLWPESLAATGFVKNAAALRMVGWLVRGIYRCCDTLLVQSRAFVEPVSRYAPLEKIVYYPNSMDSRSEVAATVLPEPLVDVLAKHFCVVFAGNLGTAQALDTLVEAAVQLRDDPDVRLVLVGSGSRLAWLQSQKEVLGLDNLVLPGRFPMESMPAIFERSAVLLVSLSDQEIFAQTVPSKIQAYLAAGRPIVASLNGEGAKVVIEAGAGMVSAAEQAEPLVSNLLRMRAMDKDEREQMGRSGRKYFNVHFDMDAQVKRLVEILS
ncbi:glycosyltransferase family 4 protein [Pseudomonas sichuanensis]|uniref:Glycosyltransferase family 4 protein n=1 Tax=Pseudomonas sichuanensis TaxID=2213015 RepID=A0ABV0DDT5_9PSED